MTATTSGATATAGVAPERRDDGLFGPGSVTWKVHANPVMIVGGLRALMIQALHPLAMAGVAQYSDFRADPLRRLHGTARYVEAVTFGDTEAAHEAAERVKRLHLRVKGIDTVTGRPFSAGDPETMVWVHCVEIHSFLAAYRAYGGRLSDADQDRYLAEQVAAAELLDVPAAMVPDSRAAYRDYFAGMLGRLCSSADAAATIQWVARGETPPVPGAPSQAGIDLAFRTIRQAAVALIPRSLRPLAGLPEPSSRHLPAAAAVVLGSNAVIASRRVPFVGGWVEAQFTQVLGTQGRLTT
jgi:uncharacterized protein (DUF2236 family)